MAAASFVDEAKIMEVDAEFEERFSAFQAEVASALDEAQEPGFDLPRLSDLDWAEPIPGYATTTAAQLACTGELFRHRAEACAGRPGEEKLRYLAAWWDTRRAEAERFLPTSRRLWDRYLRSMLEAAEAESPEDVFIHMAAKDFLRDVYAETGVPWPQRADEVDAAARAAGRGARFAEKHARRAGLLRRAAAGFAGKPGEEKLVAALREHAAWVEAQCADAEGLVAKLVSSPYWRVWRHVNGPEPGVQLEANLLPTLGSFKILAQNLN